MTGQQNNPLDGMPWKELALAAGPVAVALYALPAAAAWLHDGTTQIPMIKAIAGTAHAIAHAHREPELSYPAVVARHLPGARGYWATAAWLAVTVAALAFAALRHIEPHIARERLDRRPGDPRGARPRPWARAATSAADARTEGRILPGPPRWQTNSQ